MSKIIVGLLFFVVSIFANDIVVFAASSTKLAMQEIVKDFEKIYPDTKITIYFSATGKAYAQFTHGFKYDIFLAADTQYPESIAKQGDALSDVKIYAHGAVALYSKNKALIKEGIEVLATDKVKKISIANPRLAPYGVAALEILQSYKLNESVSGKIVQGDNISQSVQFVDSGAADVGFVAYSLIKNSAEEGEYLLVDPRMYKPLMQAFVITKYAKEKPSVHLLAEYILSPKAQTVFQKYGFTTP
ncbi:MAG: molybdate ABC transporter substrate-binding protein [Sulfurimonadaceae bacterium]|jgi:molybdate transport system substrate-binding protein|nr:molybdate ABC transporter substrate-binding protein [Sulfurimonadaceae bacterium]